MRKFFGVIAVCVAGIVLADTMLQQGNTNIGPVNRISCGSGLTCTRDGGQGVLEGAGAFWFDGGAAVFSAGNYSSPQMFTPWAVSNPDAGVSLWVEGRGQWISPYIGSRAPPTMIIANRINGPGLDAPSVEWRGGGSYVGFYGSIFGSQGDVGGTLADGGSRGPIIGLNIMGGPNVAFVRPTTATDPSARWAMFTDTAPGGMWSYAPPGSNAVKIMNDGAFFSHNSYATEGPMGVMDGGCVTDGGTACRQALPQRLAIDGKTIISAQYSPPSLRTGSSGTFNIDTGYVNPNHGNKQGWEGVYIYQTDGGSVGANSTVTDKLMVYDASRYSTCLATPSTGRQTPGIIVTCGVSWIDATANVDIELNNITTGTLTPATQYYLHFWENLEPRNGP